MDIRWRRARKEMGVSRQKRALCCIERARRVAVEGKELNLGLDAYPRIPPLLLERFGAACSKESKSMLKLT